MFGLEGAEAETIHSKQAKRKQGFGAFLRELSQIHFLGQETRAAALGGGALLRHWILQNHRLERQQRTVLLLLLQCVEKRRAWIQQWVGLGSLFTNELNRMRGDSMRRAKGRRLGSSNDCSLGCCRFLTQQRLRCKRRLCNSMNWLAKDPVLQ